MSSNVLADADRRYDCIFKVILLGDAYCGKSNLISRVVSDTFISSNVSTIGLNFQVASFEADDKLVKVHIIDTAGQERFRSIVSSFYRRADAAILVYDITNYESFEHLDYWIKDLNKYGKEDIAILVVGNKSDLSANREVSEEQAIQFAKQHNLSLIEASALDSTNVDKAFKLVINEILNQIYKKVKFLPTSSIRDTKTIELVESPKKKKCC